MFRRLLRHIACIAIVLSIVGVETKLVAVNATTAALTFLLAVLLIATIWGLAEAVTASVAGMLAFNFFFLPPLGKFTIEDPQNWVALLAFLVTAITTSQLSARAQRRAIEAQRRRRETEQLYGLGRAILLNETFQRILPNAVADITRIFEMNEVAIFDAASQKIHRHGSGADDARLREVAQSGQAFHSPEQKYSVVPVHLGGRPIGSLSIRGDTGTTLTLVEAIANLIAIAFERARAIDTAASAEAARRNEELRAAMLDGLAHDLKTPLTAIKASVTSLISGYPRTEERKEELLTIVNEETDRLHRIVSDAIQMGRIDSGKVGLQRSRKELDEMVTNAWSDLNLAPSRLEFQLPGDIPALLVDGDLFAQALKQLFDNANRYSPPGSPIAVSARIAAGSVVISVADAGPGIAPSEQSHIFDKFYRGTQSLRFPEGTGMGLAIAKGIVEAHGGKISVSAGQGGGSVFSVELPLIPEQVNHE